MWFVACVVNTVNIPNECKHDLFDEAQDQEEELWDNIDDVTDKSGLLNFNPDDGEDIDYLANHDNIIKVLKRYEVEGDICFVNFNDNAFFELWGYRFDGKGGMKKLEGKIVWEEK